MEYWAPVIMLVSGLVVAFLAFQFIIGTQINGETLDCYDEHNNVMIDQKCVSDNGFDSEKEREEMAFLVIVVTLISTLLFSIGGFVGLNLGNGEDSS